MVAGRSQRILTINSGSSSIKFALYRMGAGAAAELSGSVAGINRASGLFQVKGAQGKTLVERQFHPQDHKGALEEITRWLKSSPAVQDFDAVGHRLVHGGIRFTRPHRITPDLMDTLVELTPLAPDHLPHEIDAIKVFKDFYPDVTQVACFDTAFHRNMPRVAQIYPLPGALGGQGVLRYGFHGLSYEYILGELRKESGAKASEARIVMAHLGNGASMVAVKGGKSMDTTMGFSPAGGLVMSTRSGDLDPGVILYLFKEKALDVPAVNRMVNKEGGLLGVSGISADMEDLLKAEVKNPRAAEAVELFCYQAKKFLGALAAVLGGLETLIFTGGIGENAAPIRWRICEGLEFLGVRLDKDRNDRNDPIISPVRNPVMVRVIKTNEELMIARHTHELLKEEATAGGDPGI